MGPSQKLLWKIYAGVLGTVAVMATQKLLQQSWKAATGNEPPEVNDPETKLSVAASWALASGLGVGLAQLLTNRFAARRWERNMGVEAPEVPKLKVQMK